MLVRNKYTYANSEVSIRLLKEQILHRTKSFNILQLVDTLTTALTGYYETRLLNCVNNRAQSWESKYYMPADRIQELNCSQSSETEYIVRHPKGDEYLVNQEIGACTCAASMDGTLCKHQYAVLVNFNLNCESFVPSKDVLAKKHLYYIATGEQIVEGEPRWCGTELLHPKVELANQKTGLVHPMNPKTELLTLNTQQLQHEVEIYGEVEMAHAKEEEKRGQKVRRKVRKTKFYMIDECIDNDEVRNNANDRKSNTNIKELEIIAKKRGNHEERLEESNKTRERATIKKRGRLKEKKTYGNDCDELEDKEQNKNTIQYKSKVKDSKRKHPEQEIDTENDEFDDVEEQQQNKNRTSKVLLKETIEGTNNKTKRLKITKCHSNDPNAKQTICQNKDSIDEIEHEIETDLEHIEDDIANAECEKDIEILIATDSDIDTADNENIEYIDCNETDDLDDCNEFNDNKLIENSRQYCRRKIKDSKMNQMEKENDTNGRDTEDDHTLDENDFLSEDYTVMLSAVYNQTICASKRDADIEKELILEELKDMVSVVPAEIIEDKSEDTENIKEHTGRLKDQQKCKESGKEALLGRLKDMFRITGEKLIYSYDLYKPAIEAMVTAFEGIKSDSGVLSAFHAFGKANTNLGIKKSEINATGTKRNARENVSTAGTKRNIFQSISAVGDKRNVSEDRKRATDMEKNAVVDTLWTSSTMKEHFLELNISGQDSNKHVTEQCIGPSDIKGYEDNTVTTSNNKHHVVDRCKGNLAGVKRYLIEENMGTIGNEKHAIAVLEDKRETVHNKRHVISQTDAVTPGEVLITYNIAQSVDGTYAYLDEGLYNIVVDSNSELQDNTMDTAFQDDEHRILR
ncbi:hypothetical protein WDU94_002747 [Cyamophila willieti]